MLETWTLGEWIVEALGQMGGSAKLIDVVKRVWKNHQKEIEASGDSFFTWQYDIRCVATMSRKQKKLKAAETSPTGVWELPSRHFEVELPSR